MVLNDRENRTIDNWQKFLNDWIKQYVIEEGGRPNAQRPLREGHIAISQAPWLEKYTDVLDAEILYPTGENPSLNVIDAELCIKPAYQLPLTTLDTRFTIRNIPIGTNRETILKAEESKIDTPDNQVRISYQTELNGVMESLELPFVVGVIGDFIGNPLEPFYSLRQRKFIEIDIENFDQVLAAFKPRVKFKVENTLADDGSELEIELNFRSFADFSADGIACQIKPLQELLKIRDGLRNLSDRLDKDFKLEDFLQESLANPIKLNQLLLEIDTNTQQ